MSYIPIVTAGVFLLLLLLERIAPLRQAKHLTWRQDQSYPCFLAFLLHFC